MTYIEKISKLRNEIQAHDLDGYLLTIYDEFGHKCKNNMIQWFVGLNASNAILIVAKDQVLLYTDSRYILAANETLNFNLGRYGLEYFVHDMRNINIAEDIYKNIAHKDRGNDSMKIGFVSHLMRSFDFQSLDKSKDNFVTSEEISDIPSKCGYKNERKNNKLYGFCHIDLFHESDIDKKIEEIRINSRKKIEGAKMISQIEQDDSILYTDNNGEIDGIDENPDEYLLLADLSSIAWLLNIRGNYSSEFPVVPARLLINLSTKRIYLVCCADIVSGIQEYLNKKGILNISDIQSFFAMHEGNKIKIYTETKDLMHHEMEFIRNICKIYDIENPCISIKAQKNSAELYGMALAHLYDAFAMNKFLNWLKNAQNNADKNSSLQEITEQTCAEYVTRCRMASPLFYANSFAPISAYQEHSSMPHYRVEDNSNRAILRNDSSNDPCAGIYLLDSGGHYLCGTTDITRVMVTCNKALVTNEMKALYTSVLRGHIALANAVFPKNTTGAALDSLARQYLWRHRFDYGHGTGHGVGAFLYVHEGPQSIYFRKANDVSLKSGMITSIEPGVYLDSMYGFRIENLYYIGVYDESMTYKKMIKNLIIYYQNQCREALSRNIDLTHHEKRVYNTRVNSCKLFNEMSEDAKIKIEIDMNNVIALGEYALKDCEKIPDCPLLHFIHSNDKVANNGNDTNKEGGNIDSCSANISRSKDSRDYLQFYPLTFAHIDTDLIDKSALFEDERRWLNAYNEVSDAITASNEIRMWLEKFASRRVGDSVIYGDYCTEDRYDHEERKEGEKSSKLNKFPILKNILITLSLANFAQLCIGATDIYAESASFVDTAHASKNEKKTKYISNDNTHKKNIEKKSDNFVILSTHDAVFLYEERKIVFSHKISAEYPKEKCKIIGNGCYIYDPRYIKSTIDKSSGRSKKCGDSNCASGDIEKENIKKKNGDKQSKNNDRSKYNDMNDAFGNLLKESNAHCSNGIQVHCPEFFAEGKEMFYNSKEKVFRIVRDVHLKYKNNDIHAYDVSYSLRDKKMKIDSEGLKAEKKQPNDEKIDTGDRSDVGSSDRIQLKIDMHDILGDKGK